METIGTFYHYYNISFTDIRILVKNANNKYKFLILTGKKQGYYQLTSLSDQELNYYKKIDNLNELSLHFFEETQKLLTKYLSNRGHSSADEEEEYNINNILNTIKQQINQKEKTGENVMENTKLDLLIKNATEQNIELNNILSQINEELTNVIKENKELKEKIKVSNPELNIGNIQALKIFKNIEDFNIQTKNLFNVNSWTIYPGSATERANIIKEYQYYKTLKKEFNDKNLTSKNLTDEQLISFFDTLSLMYVILNQINDEKIKKEMKIIMEYVIPEPSRPRIDYMLIFRNNIYLLEFQKADKEENYSNLQTQKLQQVNGYATMLKNNLNNDKIKIQSAVAIYLDESCDSNIEITSRTIDDIKKKINKAFKNDENKNAFELLSELE